MDRTIEIMAGQETPPAETPSGGTLSTDFSEQLILLGNRISALEMSINRLSRLIEPEQESPAEEPEPDSPAEDEAEPEQDSPDDNTEAEPDSPAESEE